MTFWLGVAAGCYVMGFAVGVPAFLVLILDEPTQAPKRPLVWAFVLALIWPLLAVYAIGEVLSP